VRTRGPDLVGPRPCQLPCRVVSCAPAGVSKNPTPQPSVCMAMPPPTPAFCPSPLRYMLLLRRRVVATDPCPVRRQPFSSAGSLGEVSARRPPPRPASVSRTRLDWAPTRARSPRRPPQGGQAQAQPLGGLLGCVQRPLPRDLGGGASRSRRSRRVPVGASRLSHLVLEIHLFLDFCDEHVDARFP